MKNSGKERILFVLLFIFSFTPILSSNIEFTLAENQVALGEVVFLDVKNEGSEDFKPLEKKYETENALIFFVGDSFETQIINFKVTKKHILKYQVSGKRLGKFKLPTIRVLLDNQVIESETLFLEVIGQKKSLNHQPQGILDQIFGEEQEAFAEAKPPEVAFHTSKNICYVGEPIVGYYVLYSNGFRQPFLERDPNQSISFPFFLSEILNQVTIQIDPSINRNGTMRDTLVYLKEIYGLTPLRAGTFSLGKTNFIVGDSMRFGYANQNLPVKPGEILVLPLPSGSPKNFAGAIGEYELSVHAKPYDVHLGETYYFSIRVFGSGAGIGIEDPLDLNPTNASRELYLLKKEKSKVFRKLPEGEFGFYSVVEFYYSFQTKKEGRIEFPIPRITFFSTKRKTYETKMASIPDLFVKPKRTIPQSNTPEGQIQTQENKFPILWMVLGLFGLVGLILFTKTISKKNQTREQMERLNEKIGTKRGEILKDYLLRHGISEKEASVVAEYSLAFPSQRWEKIYTYCNKEDKQILARLSEKLNT